jgi:phage tail-like protein
MRRREIERLLPAVFQETVHEGTPILAILEVMEALHAPSEGILASVDGFFNPYRAPDRFIPFLARWMDLDWLLAEPSSDDTAMASQPLPSGLGRLRELVANAADLARWRGTRHGLIQFLEIATGVRGFVIDEQVVDEHGTIRPFHLRVTGPAAAEPYRAMVDRIVAVLKPAYVTYELAFAPEQGG